LKGDDADSDDNDDATPTTGKAKTVSGKKSQVNA
jgi:hypothetical protein